MKPSGKEVYGRLMVLRSVIVHGLATPPKTLLREMAGKWTESERSRFDADSSAAVEVNIAKMKEAGLWKFASPKERLFLHSSGFQMDEYAQLASGWRMECAATMMWALRFIEKWPSIDVEASTDLLKQIPVQRVTFFSKHPPRMPDNEIKGKRDFVEFWHWRVRTRQLIEEGMPLEPTKEMKLRGMNSHDDIVRIAAKKAHKDGLLSEIMDDDFVFLGKPFRLLSQEEYQLATSIIMERHYALNWLCGMASGNCWDKTPTDT